MRIAALVLLGAICIARLPVDLLPAVTLPTVGVVTTWPNVSPEEVETQVTRPIEQAVSAAPNLYLVNSSSLEGSSIVRVQFTWGTDIGQAAVDVLQLVERARQAFPTDPTLETPVVFKFDPTQLPILIFGVSGESDPVKLRTLLDNEVTPMIESAAGVASAVTSGGQERAIIVNLDPVRMQAHGVSVAQVIARIGQENVNLPAGIGKQSRTEYVIRSLGWALSPADLAQIPLTSDNGQIVKLSDVADVQDSHPEQRVFTRLNGQPSVGMIISKQSNANTVATAQAVFQRIKDVQRIYPQLQFGLAYNQAQYIVTSVHDVEMNAVVGGLLAVIILLFFLRNVRSTLVIALSIPISIISTFALIYLAGFTINTMTLGGLALSTGLIVDDAVVVLENIFRHTQQSGEPPMEAAVNATDEIISAVFASTWTIMVVFLPLLLIKGQAGQMFTSFALVVIFAIAISLLDATTVVPMLSTRLILGRTRGGDLTDMGHGLLGRAFGAFGSWFDRQREAYREALRWCLHHRLFTLLVAVLITVSALFLAPHIGTELMPQTDSGDFSVNVKMPVGTALSETNRTMKRVEKILMDDPDVATIFSASGSLLTLRGTTAFTASYQGSVTVKLKDERKHTTAQVITRLRQRFARLPAAQVFPAQLDLVSLIMTGGQQNVEVDIFGDDLNTLSELSNQVMDKARNITGYQNIDVNWQAAQPEIQWVVDREQAANLGVTFSDVANTINTATNGYIASYYQESGFQYQILVQMPEGLRKTIAQMQDLTINGSLSPTQATAATPSPTQAVSATPTFATTSSGRSSSTQTAPVLLSQVATPHIAMGPSEITRLDRQRYIAITGNPEGRSAGQIQQDMQQALADFRLPVGYRWDWGITQKRQAEEFSGMGLAVVLAIGLIYMLLASQFEDFVHPLTVLFTVPLAATGVILALFLSGRTFGLTAFIGVLMLVGIVVKNGILLVDYTKRQQAKGLSREEALLVAGPTRLRPILMTASAAVLGMLPLALQLGRGSEVQSPMATAVIGGLTTSTLLTIFVVPVVYTLLDDAEQFVRRLGKPKAGPVERA